jgi:hypothetical protein
MPDDANLHGVQEGRQDRFTDADLHAFIDRPFPPGFAGVDVIDEVVPASETAVV